MDKLILGSLVAILTHGTAAAESKAAAKGINDRSHSAQALVTEVHDPLVKRGWVGVAPIQNVPTPLDEAALFLTNLVGESPGSVSDTTQGSELRIRPWFGSRASIGVKVELSW
jgi:hypothetical protein